MRRSTVFPRYRRNYIFCSSWAAILLIAGTSKKHTFWSAVF